MVKAKMIFFYMVIATLATSLAKGASDCNISDTIADQQCFGALGEPLIFHLPPQRNKTSLKKNRNMIFMVTDNTKVLINKYRNDFAFFPNGTFRLYNTTKRDSGDYKLETYSSTDGILLHIINISLEIQAPVSEPVVSQECLSTEQKKVSCSSKGDKVHLTLTLDNNLLIQSTPGNTTEHHHHSVTIRLYGQLTGNLTCHVQNNVSSKRTFIILTSCTGSISLPSPVIAAVIPSVSILLLLLALYFGIKHLNMKRRPQTVNEGNTEDEIIYSDVIITYRSKTRPNTHQNAT
ncbi:CD48 antigen-like isoform X2 [Mastacembelus armatus]|uniref:CD48 antigen-like isoform X2 n=1 Tax=Mastacembelus armatus TaxID=205130 RepID=UPI000E46151A|nr:CD48 antigen-like isoform X2 [Mastacembelus armatus]